MCITNTLRHRHVASQGLLLKLAIVDDADSAAAAVPQCQTDANDDSKHFNVKANPKARRGTLKPGTTAMNHTRRFVVHEYHDRAPGNDDFQQESVVNLSPNTSVVFPTKLHLVLNDAAHNGWEHIVSWSPHGRCFVIHNPNEFVTQIMPKYFKQSKLTSFQRQLNLYGFNRLTRDGPDRGGYYHEYFLRGMPSLTRHMVRTKVKGSGIKAASSPEQEPNLYQLSPVVVSNASRHDEEMTTSTTSIHNDIDVAAARISLVSPETVDCDTSFEDIDLSSMDEMNADLFEEYHNADEPDEILTTDDVESFDAALDNDWLLGFMLEQIIEAP